MCSPLLSFLSSSFFSVFFFITSTSLLLLYLLFSYYSSISLSSFRSFIQFTKPILAPLSSPSLPFSSSFPSLSSPIPFLYNSRFSIQFFFFSVSSLFSFNLIFSFCLSLFSFHSYSYSNSLFSSPFFFSSPPYPFILFPKSLSASVSSPFHPFLFHCLNFLSLYFSSFISLLFFHFFHFFLPSYFPSFSLLTFYSYSAVVSLQTRQLTVTRTSGCNSFHL